MTVTPGFSRCWPSVTTLSPGARPELTADMSPSLRATAVRRNSIVLSCLTSVDERAVLPGLDGDGRDDGRIGDGALIDLEIDILPRP